MRRDLAGHGDDPLESDLRAQAAAPQGVDQILGGHVAGRDLGERAAAQAGERGLEAGDPRLRRGEDVGHAEAVGVVWGVKLIYGFFFP